MAASPAETAARARLWYAFALAGLIAAGIVFRLTQYFSNRSLWIDESWLALNVVKRTMPELLQPLDFHQAAPLGFLLISRAAVGLLGSGELALRLFPLFCGVASLFLFLALARRCLGQSAVLMALAIFVLGGPLIYYSSEFKQYSVDVAAALIITLMSVRYLEGVRRLRNIAVFALAGAAAVWFSHPAVFVLAGCGTVLAATHALKKEWGRMFILLLAPLVWLASFSAEFFLFLRRIDDDHYLEHFWKHAFMPLPPRSLQDIRWYLTSSFKVFSHPLGLEFAGLGALLFVLGCLRMARSSMARFSLLAAPLLLVLLASGIRMYPFAERLILFLVPAFAMLIAAGVETLVPPQPIRSGAAYRQVLAPLAAGLLLLHPLFEDVYHLFKPRVSVGNYKILEQTRPLLEHMWANKLPGDAVFVYPHAVPAFSYYAIRYQREDQPYFTVPEGSWEEYEAALNSMRGKGRVWVLLSHFQDWPEDRKFFVHALNKLGPQLDQVEAVGAELYLYDVGVSELGATAHASAALLPDRLPAR